MLNEIKKEANVAYTENGALSLESSGSDCLDFFSKAGSMRHSDESELLSLFNNAWAENSLDALKLLFFLRDIRGGLGERKSFRTIVRNLTVQQVESIKKNYEIFQEMGRYDDLLELFDTPCEESMLEYVKNQYEKDLIGLKENTKVSLLAKWLPSINASNSVTINRAKRICLYLGVSYKDYRKNLSLLRDRIHIIENNLRLKDYTFDYSKQCSRAMLKYIKAFFKNDTDRYIKFHNLVAEGKAKINTDTLMPYDIVIKCYNPSLLRENGLEAINALDVTWNNLPNYTKDENALVVVDGSGSMYGCSNPTPASVAQSLGIYFAERCKGPFHNHFITFSNKPRLIEIKGSNIFEKVQYCMGYNEVANTNIHAVFNLLLKAAIKNDIKKEDMVKKLYIISDMEFDQGCYNNDKTNFEVAKEKFEEAGYDLPTLVFWSVAARGQQSPVKKDETGTILVSGFSPVLFRQVTGEDINPYLFMREIIDSKRYEKVAV